MKQTKMYQLRELLIDTCMDTLKRRRVIGVDDQGQDILEPISPAMLNVIRQTLSDNGITREPLDAAYSETMDVKQLPFEDTIDLPDGPPLIEQQPNPSPQEHTGQKVPVTGKARKHIKPHA